MPALKDLDSEQLRAVSALVVRLKHDLGKYVAFGARWLQPDAPLPERARALREDLLQTRRGPDGSSDALEVWRPYASVLTGDADLSDGVRVDVRDEPAVQDLVTGMRALVDTVAGLRADALDEAGVDRGLTLARQVSDGCRQLHRRVRELEQPDG